MSAVNQRSQSTVLNKRVNYRHAGQSNLMDACTERDQDGLIAPLSHERYRVLEALEYSRCQGPFRLVVHDSSQILFLSFKELIIFQAFFKVQSMPQTIMNPPMHTPRSRSLSRLPPENHRRRRAGQV